MFCDPWLQRVSTARNRRSSSSMVVCGVAGAMSVGGRNCWCRCAVSSSGARTPAAGARMNQRIGHMAAMVMAGCALAGCAAAGGPGTGSRARPRADGRAVRPLPCRAVRAGSADPGRRAPPVADDRRARRALRTCGTPHEELAVHRGKIPMPSAGIQRGSRLCVGGDRCPGRMCGPDSVASDASPFAGSFTGDQRGSSRRNPRGSPGCPGGRDGTAQGKCGGAKREDGTIDDHFWPGARGSCQSDPKIFEVLTPEVAG